MPSFVDHTPHCPLLTHGKQFVKYLIDFATNNTGDVWSDGQ